MNYLKTLIAVLLTVLFTACASTQQTTQPQTDTKEQATSAKTQSEHKPPSQLDRLVPNPINNEIPNAYYQAVDNGTRTMSGKPGKNYWTQRANYDMDVELVPEDTLIKGQSVITYYNNSPDTLNELFMELTQNYHKAGVQRNERAEITGGVNLKRLALDGTKLNQLQSRRDPSGYAVDGTIMYLRPSQPMVPGDSVKIEVSWDFKIPQQGASGRMGYSNDNLYFIGYWYPQMRVYDDVIGWMTDPFTGNAEFYHDFANYNVDITVPEQWMVASTGRLTNGKDVLKDNIYQRLTQAHQSDSVMHVVTQDDFGKVTQSGENGTLTWNFKADDVRDFAFSVTKESMWDATRVNVGDRNGDGTDDYTSINAIYRNSAPLWKHGAQFTSDAIGFLSQYTGLSYPWPHMTSVEGGGIIGGGMEYPMMTIIGRYQGRPAQALNGVIAHELAHMWVPMIVSSNERRYAWMDEGTTTFNENQAMSSYYPNGSDFNHNEFQNYLQIAGTDAEGPIMRWSDYQYNGAAYYVASYPKPASLLVSLRNLLGEETFNKAYRTFIDRWKYKHPYPWDLFNTFEDVSGRDLDWFWRSWYYETWTLDQAVGSVMPAKNGQGTTIIIEDHDQAPMPATVEITLSDGSTITRKVPVDRWLKGATQIPITVNGDVTKVVIDPNKNYPDNNRSNNTWKQ